ncbi:hypothetical protein Daus18300_014475 [Diaporthe australafricana]|uniref:Uncharacterized protein n=1 Tax=Diaporthe australafricana TaxID=127596 RepID=A0ABR3VV38_9PEZI
MGTSSHNASIGGHSRVSGASKGVSVTIFEPVKRGSLVAGVLNGKKSSALSCSDSSKEGSVRARGGDSNSDGSGGASGGHSGILLVQGTAYPDNSLTGGSLGNPGRRRLVWGRFPDGRVLAGWPGRRVPGTKGFEKRIKVTLVSGEF